MKICRVPREGQSDGLNFTVQLVLVLVLVHSDGLNFTVQLVLVLVSVMGLTLECTWYWYWNIAMGLPLK